MSSLAHQPLTPARRLFSLVAAGGVLIGVYASIGVYLSRSDLPMHEVPTALDHAAPFQPAWVLVYALVFLQAIAPLSSISDLRVLHRTLGAYLTLYAFAVPVWLGYPVAVPRHPVPITDVWTYGVGIVRYVDPPANCMPSMHVGLAVLAALIVLRHDRAAGTFLLGTAAAIWWSTIAIRQHWATDGLVAAAMALAADRVWFDLRPLPDVAFRPLKRHWHLVWLGLYVAGVLILMSGWWWGWMPVHLLPPNTPAW